ncbi:MAG: glycosyltransferase family 4 protein [Methanoregula sp.]|jgi:glycosyltransferase involved in cell wall biosynthesis|uniref:glycosyltransferase family 4 protein n=1 Tax=Methanoregula sp. TaxID=2052170 RepID=UPI003C147A19
MPETDRMKIAFVYDVIYPYVKGGVEKRVWELAVRLTGRGHEVHIFGMKYWDGDAILIRDGVVLHGVCPARSLYAGGKRNLGEALTFGLRLIPHLGRYRFDVIDCQQFPFFSCFTAKSLTTIKRTPLVITWHEVWGDYWYTYLGRSGAFGKYIERLVYRLTPYVIAVSKTTSEQLVSSGGKDMIRIIPNGVDGNRISAIPPATDRSDLIFAGRLIREKHADLLVRAFALLSKEQPALRLLIIGDGPEREPLLHLVQECNLNDRISVRGFEARHDDLIAQMKASKVCVLPSTREGFGITALEALACGLPVVTVDHPANAIRDLITEKNGFLSALSAEDLAEKMRDALAHHKEMREACIVTAAEYDWDRVTVESEEYYRSVIAKTGSAHGRL